MMLYTSLLFFFAFFFLLFVQLEENASVYPFFCTSPRCHRRFLYVCSLISCICVVCVYVQVLLIYGENVCMYVVCMCVCVCVANDQDAKAHTYVLDTWVSIVWKKIKIETRSKKNNVCISLVYCTNYYLMHEK